LLPIDAMLRLRDRGRFVSALMDEEKRTVKRKLTALAMLAMLAVVAWSGNLVTAQAPVAAPQAPVAAPRPLQTRIGLMNMVQVLKEYKKFMAIEESIKKRAMEIDGGLQPFRTEVLRLRELYNNVKTPQEEKEKIEHRTRQLQLDAQLKEDEAKKELIKMNGEAATQIFKEVEDAVNLYARSNNLELVLFYNDAVTDVDYYHPANLQRKLTQPAAVMPLFVTPGMDISKQIVAALNARYAPTAAAPQAPRPGVVPGAVPAHPQAPR